MIKSNLSSSFPQEAADQGKQLQQASSLLTVPTSRILHLRLLKRSIDARWPQVKIRLLVEVFIDEIPKPENKPEELFHFKKDVSRVNPYTLLVLVLPACSLLYV